MQKWEYKYLTASRAKDDWYIQRIDGQEVPDPGNAPTVGEYLNRLGEEGWELVSELITDPAPTEYSIDRVPWDRNIRMEGLLPKRAEAGWDLVTVCSNKFYTHPYDRPTWLIVWKNTAKVMRLRLKRPKEP